jgi:hypothetical protein
VKTARATAPALAPLLALAVCACGAPPAGWHGGSPAAPEVPSPASPAPPPPVPIAAKPDVELREPHAAVVGGQRFAFDGIEEGLAWPALAKALGPRKAGDVVSIQSVRSVPIQDVLRVAWTERVADLHVQSPDSAGVLHAVVLRARREGVPAVAGCHLAVFLRPDGSLRVAAPGGHRELGGEQPAELLARSLEAEGAKCPIKYVAFGAESDATPWGGVFDVLLAVDRDHAAGDARYVLGQALHTPGH